MPKKKQLDTIAHFEQVIDELPDQELAKSIRQSQHDVAAKKDQAEANEELLGFRMHAGGDMFVPPPRSA